MKQYTTGASQRIAARIAGTALLLIIVTGIVGTMIGRDHIVVSGDAAATALNIMAHQTRFRVGTAFEIVMFNCDVVLAVALYVLLKPVNAPFALLGAFWRLANAVVLGVSVALSLAALDFLGGAHYLTVFNANQLHAQAKFFLDMHETGSLVGLIFFSLGAAVHSYLLLKSAYIPRILSGFYLFGAIWLLLCCFGFIIAPESMTMFNTAYEAIDQAFKSTIPGSRRVLVWLTDGSANLQNRFTQRTIGKHSPEQLHSREEATEKLVRSGVVVSALIERSAAGDATIAFAYLGGSHMGDINRYADMTGGPVLKTSKPEVAAKLGELIDELRRRETLGYKPMSMKPPGTYCKLTLQLSPAFFVSHPKIGMNDVLIRTKQGYYR